MTVCAMHSYSIKAFDAVGNESQPSSLTQLISTIDCPDVIAPTAPSGLTALPEGYTKVNLKWNAATDNVGVVGYILSTPGADIKLGNVLTHSLTVASCKTYNYYVKALDAAGNISMASNNFTTIMPCEPVVDTIPPTTPTNFTVISNIGTTANLTWTASTDNVAVTGYRVSRDGINIATTTNTSYADKTVSCTYYVYGIRAVDAAGNSSTEKTQTITTAGCPEVPDTVSPTVKITSPVNGQTIAAKGNLSVTVAASDNIGVSKVQIFLDNSLIVSDTSSPYSGNINVNKLTSGAHVLKAVAFDGAGNTSSSLITVSK
jgi:chitodextrinase